MTQRQKPIPVTSDEREFLNEQKERYETRSGDTGDWGKFLETMALLGLAAAGIYILVKALQVNRRSANVRCSNPGCGKDFTVALQPGAAKAILVNCPHCQAELVVQL